MFTVLPTFYTQSGMSFDSYIKTLDPNNLYEYPQTITEHEIELLPELHDIDDNDTVEITVDETVAPLQGNQTRYSHA